MENSLYNLMDMKSENSVLKSVYVEHDTTYCNEVGWTRFAVETYDLTFLNAKKNVEKTFDYIDKMIDKYMELKGIKKAFITHYSLFDYHYEYLKTKEGKWLYDN